MKSVKFVLLVKEQPRQGLHCTIANPVDDKKRRYAEKMAKAHLRSTGMGEYTPKSTLTRIQSSSTGDDEAGPSSRWKTRSNSDDDFDF